MFYVYEWYIKNTGEIFYVGKGCKSRYKTKKHNQLFRYILEHNECESRIIKTFDNEKDAFSYEFERINQLWAIGECKANIYKGGMGGTTNWWTPEMRDRYSKENVMKNEQQRKRMSINNPMKNKDVSSKVGLKHRKPFYIGNTLYNTLVEASEKYGVTIHAIKYWLKTGHNNINELVYYENQEMPTINFPTNKHIANSQKVKYDNVEYNSIKELARALKINYTTLFNYYQKHKMYDNKYIEKI